MCKGKVMIQCGDCIERMAAMETDSVDLVFSSPPYEDARTYGIDFGLREQAWVDWMVRVITESVRVCTGLVAFVVEGKTRKFRWSATPALLMADLHRAGVYLRKPPAFCRVGIPGSGGPDWLRNDYEFVICCTSGGRLPWSDNTACGHPPKWAPGGEMSHRLTDGTRRNKWGRTLGSAVGARKKDGTRDSWRTPSETQRQNGRKGNAGYDAPTKANPGNVIKCNVGGGHMGSALACENEAPFPEKLAECFVRSFCPPDGVALDPFSGSGTTAAVAVREGRRAIAIDIRQSQCELTARRVAEVEKEMKQCLFMSG